MIRIKTKMGFTLVELLLSAAILSIIMISLYAAFNTGLLSYKKIDSAFSVFQSARIILNRMERDIANTFAYKNDDSGFTGAQNGLDFFSIIDFYSSEGRMDPSVCRIRYELDSNSLKRYLLKGSDSLNDSNEKIEEILCANIQSFILKYAAPSTGTTNPYEWQDSWPNDTDPQQKKSLPLAVKIELGISEGDKTVVFTKIAPIPR
ncbi:MAG: prepilin-type N-terminal cleavage/methylation domain-containing protein [Candidatus Omnitrophica bacterium]|nr:prepilin-type N-terminal cleavage/methylation domain-containing protein [Candidatus Omnitrophota bacterium]